MNTDFNRKFDRDSDLYFYTYCNGGVSEGGFDMDVHIDLNIDFTSNVKKEFNNDVSSGF